MLTVPCSTTNINHPPGGGAEHLSHLSGNHSFRPSSSSSSTLNNNSATNNNICFLSSTATTGPWLMNTQQQQPQPQCPNRKRTCPREEGEGYQEQQQQSTKNDVSSETTLQCPRLRAQPLSLPRKCTQDASNASMTGSCALDPSQVKANFVDSLVDTAAIVIESIWPPGYDAQCTQNKKGLPLRTFIQETLKRSRSSYSTLQTALFYLYKIRNKVPNTYLKRRQEQLHQSYPHLASAAIHHHAHHRHSSEALMTPPASPLHTQNLAEFASSLQQQQLQGSDYFSLRAAADTKSVLPSPMSSNCSMASASPASAPGYSPCSTASPNSSTASPTPSTSSPCSVTSEASSSSSNSTGPNPSSSSSSTSSQSNRIIYCGRRTFLAALMVASKYLQDRNYSNKAWAKISGLSIKEINANELIFLKLIDYSLFVSHDTFMRWTALLVAHGQEATRKFMQTVDAAHASSFAAKSLSMPPLVLNGSHIRYAPMKTTLEAPMPAPSMNTTFGSMTGCETEEHRQAAGQDPTDSDMACAPRLSKIARSSQSYPSEQSGSMIPFVL